MEFLVILNSMLLCSVTTVAGKPLPDVFEHLDQIVEANPIWREFDESACVANCKKHGFCCNDPEIGANQYLSCSQACRIRASGISPSECSAACLGPRECRRTVNGIVFGMCSSCNDKTPTCPFGVMLLQECDVGCRFQQDAVDRGFDQPRFKPLATITEMPLATITRADMPLATITNKPLPVATVGSRADMPLATITDPLHKNAADTPHHQTEPASPLMMSAVPLPWLIAGASSLLAVSCASLALGVLCHAQLFRGAATQELRTSLLKGGDVAARRASSTDYECTWDNLDQELPQVAAVGHGGARLLEDTGEPRHAYYFK